jgi:hypothetical protein
MVMTKEGRNNKERKRHRKQAKHDGNDERRQKQQGKEKDIGSK